MDFRSRIRMPNRKEKEQGEEDADGSMLFLSSIFSGLPRSSAAFIFSLSLNVIGMHSVCIERCEEVYRYHDIHDRSHYCRERKHPPSAHRNAPRLHKMQTKAKLNAGEAGRSQGKWGAWLLATSITGTDLEEAKQIESDKTKR